MMDVLFNGELVSVERLAGIAGVTVNAMYQRLASHSPEEAVSMAGASKIIKVPYGGTMMTLVKVADAEGISYRELARKYKKLGDLSVAIEEIKSKVITETKHDQVIRLIVESGESGISFVEIKRRLGLRTAPDKCLYSEDLVYEDRVDGMLMLYPMPELLRRCKSENCI